MKKIIKYLQDGEYHEATVADVGDVDLLKTESKTDLVSAINEIFVTGGQGGNTPSGYDELVDKVDKLNSKTSNNSESIVNAVADLEEAKKRLEQTAKEIAETKKQSLIDAQKAAQKALDEYKQAREVLDNKIAQAQEKLAKDIEDKKEDIEKLNEQSKTISDQLTTVKEDAEKTAQELANATLDLGKTKKQVKDLESEVSQKISNTDLDPLKEKVQTVDSEVKQTKEEISQKANKKELDLLTGAVNDVEAKLDVTANEIKGKVSKDTLGKNISDFEVQKANLFIGTRDWLNYTVNDRGLVHIGSETYKHARIATLDDGGIITLKGENLSVGESYVASINARVNKGVAKVKVNNFGEMKTVDTKESTVTNEWLRYSITFVATDSDMDITFRASGLENGAYLYLNKAKLERGTVAYPWEQNERDNYERIEHAEAKFSLYEDQISGVVKKQDEIDDKQTEMQTTLTEVADGVEANSKLIEKTKDGLVKDFEGKINATAKALSAEYEEKTNDAIGQITDSGVNLILNSSFTNVDDKLDKWQEVSSKANVVTDNEGLSWLKLSQSGLNQDAPIGAKTNYFSVKKGKLTVALDVKINSLPDSDQLLQIEFFDENNHRVDFSTVTFDELGIVKNITQKQRGLIRVPLDRNDAKKAAVKVILVRNGELVVTNFLAKNSTIDDGAYSPAPEDTAKQIIKQNTKIEQNSREIQLKANKTEIDNKLLDINNELRQEIVTQKEATLRVTNEGIENVTRKVETVRGIADNAQTTANRAQSVADSANATLGAYQKSTESSFKNLGDRIESEVSSVKSSIDNMQIGGVNRLQGSADFSWINGIGELNSPMVMIEYYSEDIKVLHTLGSSDGGIYTKWAGAFPNGEFQVGERYTMSFDAKGEGEFLAVGNESDGQCDRMPIVGKNLTSEWKRYSVSGTITELNKAFVFYFKAGYDVSIKCVKIEIGDKATPWTLAPEDVQNKINNNTQAIESANSRFVQVENGFHEAVNKIKTDVDGRITKNSNEIKSFDDKYSRELSLVKTDLGSKASQEWTQNKIEETANSVTRTIETVKNTVSSIGTPNLIVNGFDPETMNYWHGWTRVTTHTFYFNGNKNLFELETNSGNEVTARSDRFKLKHNTDYGISFVGFASSNVKDIDVYILGRKNGETQGYTKIIQPIANRKLTAAGLEYVTAKFNSSDIDEAYIRFDNNGSSNSQNASLFVSEVMVAEGSPRPYVSNSDDALQVNGVNKLQGTADFSWKQGIGSINDPNISIERYDDRFKMLHMTGDKWGGIYTKWAGAFPNGEIQIGKRYTMSFDAKGKGEFSVIGNEGDPEKNSLQDIQISSSWQRYSISGKINELGKAFLFYFNPGYDVFIKCVKIEEGNKATPWSPAPEDIQSQIDGNKQAIEINKHKLEETDKRLESQFQTINDYGNRISVTESRLKQTSDGIETTVSKIVKESNKKAGEAQNLVYNSEFINNAEGWSNIGNNPAGTILFANNEWDNWYGSNGLAFRNPSKQEYLVSDSKRFRVYEGQRLSASVQLHVTDNITHGQCRAGMEIRFYANENDPEIDTSKQQTQFMYNIQNGQQKLLYCENVEVPANANYVAIRLYTFGVGNIIFNQPMLVSGDKIQPYKQDVKATNSAITTMRQEADRWNVKVVGLESAINNKADKNKIITEINADTSGVKIAGNKNHITGETTIDDGVIKSAHIDKLDADKINGIEFSSGDNFYNKWEDRTRKPLMMNKNGIFASSSYIASVNDNIKWRIPLGHLDTGTTYNNNCLHIATIKPKGLSGRILEHGDMIIISVQINYDNGQGDSRTTVLPQFGHNPWGEPFYEEMGESYKKGVITGDYWYTWKFKWKFEYLQQAQANGNSIPIQLRFDNLKPGSHVTITNATCWSTTKYDNGVYGYREAAFEISNDGEFRGTYLAKPVIESSRNTMDVIEWHEGRLRFAHGKEGEAPYPFGEIVINGSGINIFGQADGQDRRITFWGSTPHEQIVNNGGVTGDYDSLANGIYFDNFGNIRMSKNASKFCITRNDGTDVVQAWNHGEPTLWMNNGYVSRHLGLGSSGYIDASVNGNVLFNRNGSSGYIFNSDVNIGGWLGCNSFSNRSQLSIKKDVEKADESDLATKILGIDIGTWRYKTEDADDIRHIGAVIDDVNTDKKWLIPSEFLSKDGKSVLPLNLIGGLIATVKQQAKQISDMNLKLLSMELKKGKE